MENATQAQNKLSPSNQSTAHSGMSCMFESLWAVG